MAHLSSEEGDLSQDKVWFEFLVGFAGRTFDLGEISKLPESEMKRKTEKYSELVYDLAEAALFKLERLGLAWKTLDDFKQHLESHRL